MNGRGDRTLGQECPPGNIARIERRGVWQALLPHGRAQAVCPDKHVTTDRVPIGKMSDDLCRVLLESFQTLPAMIPLRGKSIAQNAVDPLPCGEHLRAFKRSDRLP